MSIFSNLLAIVYSLIAGRQTNVEDLRVSSIPHDLTPNPIYGGPLYDTVQDPSLHKSLNIKTEPLPPIPSPYSEPKYIDSPTTGQLKLQESKDQSNGEIVKDTEDSYIFMHTRKTAAE